ncbi:MAG: hypothetical protein WC087_03155 [Candidatus Paceibacterota bacterium]
MMHDQKTIGNFNLNKIGVLEIPEDFSWTQWFLEFVVNNRHRTYFYTSSSVIELPEPGSKIDVTIVSQMIDETTTQERFEFLYSQDHLMLGQLGAALCLTQLFKEIPAGKDIYSFDPDQDNPQEEQLTKIYKGTSEVPFFEFEKVKFVADGKYSKQSLFFLFNCSE